MPRVAPTGELPVLIDGAEVVAGSDAILTHMRKLVRIHARLPFLHAQLRPHLMRLNVLSVPRATTSTTN